MEKDIFIIKSFLKKKEMLLKHPCWVSEKTIQAIKNLINKTKEQEKIIELMAEDIVKGDIDEDICRMVGQNPFCDEFGEDSMCKECVIEYYIGKARGE